MLAKMALFFSIICVVLMIVILVRFKKLFSTDSIIEKTKERMNKLIADINRNANSDIELLNESTRRIRALLKDADEKMKEFNEAAQRLREMIAETERIAGKRAKKILVDSPIYSDFESFSDDNESSYSSNIKSRTVLQNSSLDSKSKAKNVRTPSQNHKKNNPYEKKYIDPDASYEIAKNDGQGSLFNEEDLRVEVSSDIKNKQISQKTDSGVNLDSVANSFNSRKSILKDETKVTPEGAAYKEVPLIITKVYDDNAPAMQNSARPLSEKVQKLFGSGMSVEDIAAQLNCSTSEVQFIIDMEA